MYKETTKLLKDSTLVQEHQKAIEILQSAAMKAAPQYLKIDPAPVQTTESVEAPERSF
jgi:hypothetical protein